MIPVGIPDAAVRSAVRKTGIMVFRDLSSSISRVASAWVVSCSPISQSMMMQSIPGSEITMDSASGMEREPMTSVSILVRSSMSFLQAVPLAFVASRSLLTRSTLKWRSGVMIFMERTSGKN
jgi:hypothetical protein